MCNTDIVAPYCCTFLLLLFLCIGLKFCFSLSVREKQDYNIMQGKSHWKFLTDCYEFKNQIQPVPEA